MAEARSAIGAEVKPFYEAEAKARQREHGGTAPGKPKRERTLPANLQEVSGDPEPEAEPDPNPAKGEAMAQAAKAVGVSPRSAYDTAKIKKEDPDVFKGMLEGHVTMKQAKEAVKKVVSQRSHWLRCEIALQQSPRIRKLGRLTGRQLVDTRLPRARGTPIGELTTGVSEGAEGTAKLIVNGSRWPRGAAFAFSSGTAGAAPTA
ncbi:MAG: hypothetical protein AB7R89_28770 [Dehalococcoidia bacterium]